MNFLKKIALATALTAAFGAANADDAVINGGDHLHINIDVGGKVDVNGSVYVTEENSARTNNMQSVLTNAAEYSLNGERNDAHIDNGVQDVQGNLGANVSAGYSNAQSNQISFGVAKSDGSFNNAQTFNQQSVGASTLAYTLGGSVNNATLNQYALAKTRGNAGVNISAGVGNAQNNALAIAVSSDSVLTKATNSNEQIAVGSRTGVFPNSAGGPNVASIHTGALNSAQGNFGVNVTAGAGNLQSNAVSVAITQ